MLEVPPRCTGTVKATESIVVWELPTVFRQAESLRNRVVVPVNVRWAEVRTGDVTSDSQDLSNLPLGG